MVDIEGEIIITTAAGVGQDVSPTLREAKENVPAKKNAKLRLSGPCVE